MRWCDDCLLYEADPHHVEKLLRESGLETCKCLNTPGIKESRVLTERERAWFEDTKHLEGEDREEHLKGIGLKSEDFPERAPSGCDPAGPTCRGRLWGSSLG